MSNIKIGVISCSGEDCQGGTISRLATRKIMEVIRPEEAVTLCLPLFIAGGEEERGFAAAHPTITVDGCDKWCARRATEELSGTVSDSLQVGEVIGDEAARGPVMSTRKITMEQQEMVDKVAAAINVKFQRIADNLEGKAMVIKGF